MDIQGRTFLITGGASGLGAATARALVEGGGHAVLADANGAGAAEVAHELGEAARSIEMDVTNADAVQRAVDLCCDAFGGLHGVVGCAGIVNGARVVGKDGAPFPLEAFQKAVDINLVGMFNVVRLASVAMSRNDPGPDGERGVVVMTASIAAYDGQVGQAAYAASKAGVAGMTLPLARDLAQHGIRVVTIAPGIFETPMMGGLPDKVRDSLSAQTPFPSRLGKPEEFAEFACHAVHNRMLNGEVIRLDGAVRMAPK